jgi:calcineurin-like phosphoesterase
MSFYITEYLKDLTKLVDALSEKYGVDPSNDLVPTNSDQTSECTALKTALASKLAGIVGTTSSEDSGDDNTDGPTGA